MDNHHEGLVPLRLDLVRQTGAVILALFGSKLSSLTTGLCIVRQNNAFL